MNTSIRDRIEACQVYVKEMEATSKLYNDNKYDGGSFLQDMRDYAEWILEVTK